MWNIQTVKGAQHHRDRHFSGQGMIWLNIFSGARFKRSCFKYYAFGTEQISKKVIILGR